MNFISQLLFLVLLVSSGYLIYRRVKFIKRKISLGKKKYSANTDKKTRIKNLVLIAFGQSKMFKKIIPAILHLMIYAGFVIINLEVIEIILDGGVRRGTHVLKALAAGAKACSFGKIFLFSLAAGGQQGVEHLLKNMHDEINRNMVLMGCKNLKELNSSKLIYRK